MFLSTSFAKIFSQKLIKQAEEQQTKMMNFGKTEVYENRKLIGNLRAIAVRHQYVTKNLLLCFWQQCFTVPSSVTKKSRETREANP